MSYVPKQPFPIPDHHRTLDLPEEEQRAEIAETVALERTELPSLCSLVTQLMKEQTTVGREINKPTWCAIEWGNETHLDRSGNFHQNESWFENYLGLDVTIESNYANGRITEIKGVDTARELTRAGCLVLPPDKTWAPDGQIAFDECPIQNIPQIENLVQILTRGTR